MHDTHSVNALVRSTVQETLSGLGFDLRSPSDLQADMHYLRHMRRGSEDMRKIARHSLLTLLISTSAWLLWQAVRNAVR